jgi:hypothetical protein
VATSPAAGVASVAWLGEPGTLDAAPVVLVGFVAESDAHGLLDFGGQEKGSTQVWSVSIGTEVAGGTVLSVPRKLRVQYPGAIYHLMSRGDRREDIFLGRW